MIPATPADTTSVCLPCSTATTAGHTGGEDLACGQDASRAGSSPPRKMPRLAAVAVEPAAEPSPWPLLPQLQSPTCTLQPLTACCVSDLLELNVGGTLFTTTRATLEESQPQSMLAALVSGRHGPPRRDAQVGGAEDRRRGK